MRQYTLEQTTGAVTEMAPQRGHWPSSGGRHARQTQQPQLSTTGSRSSCAHPGRAHRKSARLSRESCAATACAAQPNVMICRRRRTPTKKILCGARSSCANPGHAQRQSASSAASLGRPPPAQRSLPSDVSQHASFAHFHHAMFMQKAYVRTILVMQQGEGLKRHQWALISLTWAHSFSANTAGGATSTEVTSSSASISAGALVSLRRRSDGQVRAKAVKGIQ